MSLDIICRNKLAKALGNSDKALIVEIIAYSERTKIQKGTYTPHQSRFYMWETLNGWHKKLSWLSKKTVQRYLNDLRELGWIYADSLGNGGDKTLYYAVNLAWYTAALEGDTKSIPVVKKSFSCSQSDLLIRSECPNASILTKIHTKIHTKSPHKDCIPFDLSMAKRWLDYCKIKSPNGKFNELKFAEAIMRYRTKFSLTEQMIEDLLTWIQQDDFWNKLSPSPVGLLRKSPSEPDLTKLEQVIKQIMGRKKTQSEKVFETAQKIAAEIDLDSPAADFLRLK